MLSELEEKILKHVSAEEYQPVKPRVLAKQLNLAPDQAADVRRAVKRLSKQLKIKYGANHVVYPPSGGKANEIVGKFQRAAAGYGFVRPSGTHHSMGKTRDIYIPESRTRDAATGDVVLVTTGRKPQRQEDRIRGEIVRILERRTHQFVGTYFIQSGRAYVTVDGRGFEQPVPVGDPGAKNAAVNDKVVIEMVRFPDKRRPGEAVVTEVLGDYRRAGVDTLTVMREFALPDAFPEEAMQESRRQADLFDESIVAPRQDLTDMTVITIDPVDARDFDDAISLEKLDNGHWRLGVHIADVAHFVQPGTPLDAVARDRATSIYLPDRVIPMLPEIISNNLASLQPDKVRYTKTAFIEFSAEGMPIHTEVCSSAIRSVRRFTYEEVDDFLANRTAWKAKLDADVHRLLGDMHLLAMTLRRRRMSRGALDIVMPEIKLNLDRRGKVVSAYVTEYTESHQVIEEFMLAANIAVAVRLRDEKLLFLRRVHASPSRRKIKMLTQFVNFLGLDVGGLENRFELKRLLAEVRGTPLEPSVNLSVLQSMQKAVYSPQPEGHYALAADCYCHFTSPIRRYPDLTVHRLIDFVVAGKKAAGNPESLISLGEHCSEREQRAEQAERELTKLKLLSYFSTRIGEQLQAVVTGVESYGVFVQGRPLPVEGLLHVESLISDFYAYDQEGFALVGKKSGHKFQLGDVILVKVANVDLIRRELDFGYVEHVSSNNLKKGSSRKSRPGSRDDGDGRNSRPGRGKAAHGKATSGGKGKRKCQAEESDSKTPQTQEKVKTSVRVMVEQLSSIVQRAKKRVDTR